MPLGGEGLRSPRTTVLRLATPERLRELVAWNIGNLLETLRYNARQGFGLFRIGTQFIPFGSHPANPLRWWEEFAADLRRAGDLARAEGQRLSMHTTAYVVLNSLKQGVVDAGLAEVEYQALVLDAMGLDAGHRVIVHAGVRRPDPKDAADRFRRAVDRLSERARRRVVVENDEFYWPADEVVRLARRLGVPALFDAFHHQVCGGAWRERPLPEILGEVFSTWAAADGIPKMHFSSQDPEKRAGAHGDHVAAAALDAFLEQADAAGRPFDLLLEAKAKDLAVLRVAPVLARWGVRVGPAASEER